MSWVRLDDRWWLNSKINRVEPIDRLLYIVAISWSSVENTDGHIPAHMLGFIAALTGVPKPDEAAQRLTDAGLWELEADGWAIHDYLRYQPSAEERERQAAGHRERQRRYEQSKKALTRQENVNDSVTDAAPVPSRPVPYISSSSTDSLQQDPHNPVDDDDTRARQTLELVARQLAANAGKNPKGYARAVLREAHTDGRLEEIRALAADHPTRDPTWLADEHLGRTHPPDPNCHHCGQPRHPAGPCPALLKDEDR